MKFESLYRMNSLFINSVEDVASEASKYLNELVKMSDTCEVFGEDRTVYLATDESIKRTKEIGWALHEVGGLSLMQQVAYKLLDYLRSKGFSRLSDSCELEFCWNCIGFWRY